MPIVAVERCAKFDQRGPEQNSELVGLPHSGKIKDAVELGASCVPQLHGRLFGCAIGRSAPLNDFREALQGSDRTLLAAVSGFGGILRFDFHANILFVFEIPVIGRNSRKTGGDCRLENR
jgi:hypothetical protein